MLPVSSNPDFTAGLQGWVANGKCAAELVPAAAMVRRHVRISGRGATWHGLAQDLGTVLDPGQIYQGVADVSVGGEVAGPSRVKATVAVTWQDEAGKEAKIYYTAGLGLEVRPGAWERLEHSFSIPTFLATHGVLKARLYLEGPEPGTDLLVSHLELQSSGWPVYKPDRTQPIPPEPAPRKIDESKNAVLNRSFALGTLHWAPKDNVGTLVAYPACPTGAEGGPPAAPSLVPPAWPETAGTAGTAEALAGTSLAASPAPAPFAGPTGPYVRHVGRSSQMQGPGQDILPRLKRMQTYAVTAWVKVAPSEGGEGPKGPKEPTGRGAAAPQPQGGVGAAAKEGGQYVKLYVLLGPSQWLNCGLAPASSQGWTRLLGSFRVESPFSQAVLYAQGPTLGWDIMLADVRVMEVDWSSRLPELRERTEKLRKRRVTLRVRDASGAPPRAARVSAEQVSRAFPLGSHVSESLRKAPEYERFFLDHFNYVVWSVTMWNVMEKKRGEADFGPTDRLMGWAQKHGVPARMHCLFYDNRIPDWIKDLPREEVLAAIDKRVEEVVGRYLKVFQNYDVANEMLHGGHFERAGGIGAVVRMFQKAHSVAPHAQLFISELGVDDGGSYKSYPPRYVAQILHLQSLGAPIGGVSIHGHISAPVGAHLCHVFDLVATAGLPIWVTELDVQSEDEEAKADDLEIYLREAYAHEHVHGVLLWGFWEGDMWRKKCHLLDLDWKPTAAGRRLAKLLEEWTTKGVEVETDGGGEAAFLGYPGKYKVKVVCGGKEKVLDVDVSEFGENVVEVVL